MSTNYQETAERLLHMLDEVEAAGTQLQGNHQGYRDAVETAIRQRFEFGNIVDGKVVWSTTPPPELAGKDRPAIEPKPVPAAKQPEHAGPSHRNQDPKAPKQGARA